MPGRLDNLGEVAQRLVNDFGKTASLTRITKTANKTTGKSAIVRATPQTVVITPPETFQAGRQGETQGQSRIPGAVVKEGDLITDFAALDQAKPSIGDELTFDGETFQIIAIGTIYSGENAALYPVQLRN